MDWYEPCALAYAFSIRLAHSCCSPAAEPHLRDIWEIQGRYRREIGAI